MQVRFKVHRHLPEKQHIQSYVINVQPNVTVLECLNHIKHELDGTLAFRKNCRNTICGSCAMGINGRAALACKQTLKDELELQTHRSDSADLTANEQNTTPTIEIQPLSNFPVIKDLVVDMGEFWQDLSRVNPYVSTAGRAVPEREFLQRPEDRAVLDQVGNCILCGACYAECNAKAVMPEFVGPHALAKAFRVMADSRDTQETARLTAAKQGTSGVWGCTRCLNCNTVCPMGVAPLDQIGHIKHKILAEPVPPKTRAIRHRETMIDLVAAGGWVDERRFGLRVLGNNFRDIPGLLSLIPLGLRMIQRRKFPVTFEPSLGTEEVHRLVDSVKMAVSVELAHQPVSLPPNSLEDLASEPEALSADSPSFGWTDYAEKMNGRFAMIGFLLLLLVEKLTHQGLLHWLRLL